MKSFGDRLVVQKLIYLAQAAGLDLGYYYGWYIRGPYCSAVADDMFAAFVDPSGIDDAYKNWSLGPKSKKSLRSVGSLLKKEGFNLNADTDDGNLARRLELLASVHYLIDRKQVTHDGPRAITKKLKACNKNFSEQEVTQAVKELRQARLVPSK
jgi:uncharacterized protein YwgA